MRGGGDRLGVWDGNVVKSGCDNGCTNINIKKCNEFLKNKMFLIPTSYFKIININKYPVYVHLCVYVYMSIILIIF